MTDLKAILAGMEPNPDFGTGYFARSWAMRRLAPDRLEVVMEDSSHALAMVLSHDAEKLTGVEARWERNPISSCAGAAGFLAHMAGCPLTDDLQALGLQADARSHCTHMFDTLRLGIVHIARGRPDHRYDVVMPDRLEGPQPVQLFIDGALWLEIAIDGDMTILSPDWLAGAPLMRGFAKWAEGRLSTEMFERLVIIQRAAFVSQGRRIDMPRYYGAAAHLLGPPEGSCYASQPERYADATRNPSSRPDLTLEDMLRFGFAR